MDFEVTDQGSVWSIRAVSDAAKDFARKNFAVEGWQGTQENFWTDWRIASNLAERLASEGWNVA
jgi:hypothetical protein